MAIEPGRVTIAAADEAGLFRGAGRLLAILRHPSTIYTDNSVVLPELVIRDWPDYPHRIADLTMSYWEPYNDEERLASTRRIIEILAEQGYNRVVIHLGSNYQSKYFTSNRPTPWSQEHIRSLVGFCKSRGLTPIPGFATFSHSQLAPQIHIVKEGNTQDIRHPQFREDYTKVLDEMMDLFGNPPYFRVGGDEAQGDLDRLKLTTEENVKLYTGLFNFIGDYLWDKYSCRAIIWHDMLFSAQLGGHREGDGFSEGRVVPGKEAIDALSRRIVVNYWNYEPAGSYDAVDILLKAGFQVWSSCWTAQAGIPALAKYSYERGAKGYVPTTWCFNHNKVGTLLYAGECAWNAATEKPACDYEELYLQEWSGAPWFQNPSSAKPVVFQGAFKAESEVPEQSAGMARLGNLELPLGGGISPRKTMIQQVRFSHEVHSLMQEHPDVKFFVDGQERFDMEIDRVNGQRGYLELVLYTPEQGPSTKQNKWGEDWGVFDGERVDGHHIYEPDTAIPPDGMLLSINVSGADKHNNLRRLMSHGSIRIMASWPEGGEANVLRASLSPSTRQVALVFGARLWPFTEKPLDAVAVTAKCAESQETEKISIYNDFALTPDPHFTGNFRKVFLPGGLAALVWQVPEGRTPESLELEFSAIGTAMDMRLLAAVEE